MKPDTLILGLAEPEIRELRDGVYGIPSTDQNWDACREKWMTEENVKWLLANQGSDEILQTTG